MKKNKIFKPIYLQLLIVLAICCAIPAAPGKSSQAINLDPVEQELKSLKVVFINRSGTITQTEAPPLSEHGLTLLETALKENPRDPRAHLLLARLYERLTFLTLSDEEYLTTVDCLKDPDAVADMAKELLGQGNIWYAGRLLDAGIKRFPHNVDLMLSCARTLTMRNKMERAATLYRAVIDLAPEKIGIRSELAEVLAEGGAYDDALKLAMHDLSNDPDCLKAHEAAGKILSKQGAYAQALPHEQYAFQRDPLNLEIAKEYGFAACWTGNLEEALKPAIIELSSSQSCDSSWIVEVLRSATDEELRKELLELRSLLPSDSDSHFRLARYFDQAGHHSLAILQYRIGLAMNMSAARAWFELGKDLELQTTDYTGAEACYERALDLAPYDREVKISLTQLQNRLRCRDNDLAWQMRDWLANLSTRDLPRPGFPASSHTTCSDHHLEK